VRKQHPERRIALNCGDSGYVYYWVKSDPRWAVKKDDFLDF